MSISHEIALRWMSQGPTDDESTLGQVMTWCHQAPSWWHQAITWTCVEPDLCCVTRPQWVKRANRHNTILLHEKLYMQSKTNHTTVKCLYNACRCPNVSRSTRSNWAYGVKVWNHHAITDDMGDDTCFQTCNPTWWYTNTVNSGSIFDQNTLIDHRWFDRNVPNKT